ncbi:MAG TPA: class I SAM-dependent methyltransferase [Opitutaceae bacterium]|jgi:SAM-dependent methyltransferase|nr:class I SAM-dependent methyltransferase [Opitutaceae bacterium]
MESATIARCVGILRCPITGDPLSILSLEELAKSNQLLATLSVIHRDGTPARTPLTFALGTPHRSEIYRVEDSIVWLLADLALVNASAIQTAAIAAEKKIVQSFYDDFGWLKAETGLFNDTAQFTDTRPCAQAYQRYCNARIGRELSGGKYLLDVASGSIPHAEYLEFSRHYDVRICVDFSIRALREARAKLGDAGLYLLGDITRLPLASGVVDDVISLHTVYHVPRAEQTAAIDELVRVAKPGGRAVIVYVWASSVAMNASFALRRALGRIKHALRPKGGAVSPGPSSSSATPPLYFSPQNHDWFAQEIAGKHGAMLKVWSAVSMLFQAHFFSDHGLGRLTLALVKKIEDCFPWLAGRYGQYPMFVIDKPSS